jgi:hypothetical protein
VQVGHGQDAADDGGRLIQREGGASADQGQGGGAGKKSATGRGG